MLEEEQDEGLILESGFSLSERAHETEMKNLSTEMTIASEGTSLNELRESVVNDMIGHDATFSSPMEWKAGDPVKVPLVYCDFTASHRPLKSIESYLETSCIPFYGNTHTNTSITGSQSTAFCSEARQLIGEACGAKTSGKASQDVVLFAGNGATCAVQLLIDCLGLKHYSQQDEQPLVLLGPYEHHSNLLPWRELGNVEIKRIQFRNGNVDLQHLEQTLLENQHRSVKIGSFSAASNLTGTVADDLAITALLHRYKALSVWDYATGASYLNMNMNPTHPDYPDPSLIAKDAIFFSGHKLLGAVGTPGVLVVKKRLVSQLNSPSLSGGGTVFYVTEQHHRFLSNRIERYEGGTPNVMGIWRLGLAWKFKQQLKQSFQKILAPINQTLLDYDLRRGRELQERLKRIPNLILLDAHSNAKKVPVFSFLIKCGRRFLHYNYVCALLNDIFGIQSRGGCQCAGPYAQFLLGMLDHNRAVEDWLVHSKDELMRPGATRLSLPALGTTQQQEEYVIEAIEWVAKHGWKFLHVYRCDHRAGEWRHKSRPGAPLGKQDRRWLSHYHAMKETTTYDSKQPQVSLQQASQNANQLLKLVLQDQSSIAQALKMTHENDSSSLRWYVYPKEVANYIKKGLDEVPGTNDRHNLIGALRPLAWYPNEGENNAVEPALVKSTTVESFQFRDHEHSGAAPFDEIQQGCEDGELSDACQIYNPTKDTWEEIGVFLQKMTTPTNPTDDKMEIKKDQYVGNDKKELEAFRDGERTGEAPWGEIEAGYEEGELSNQCEIYDPKTDRWENIDSVVQQKRPPSIEQKRPASIDDGADDDGAVEMSAGTKAYDLPAVEKNEKKKPQRDSSTWGQGSMVPLKPPNQANGETAHALPSKRKKSKHIKPPPKLMRSVTQAMIQWDMLQDGDRLLFGLSGGKDSMSLLHVLLEFQKKLPIQFEIEVCTIDPMTPSFDPSTLIPYVESLGLKYHYIRDDIIERATKAGKDGKMVTSLCSFCARMKRGNLYACARENNCNKLVLAQHLDDLAESFMMSVMHNGFLRTMKANYKIDAGDLSVIRPLAYCRESLMTDFAKSANLPIINENCPACFEEPKERARIKKLLSREETLYPNFYDSIKRALLPLMHDDATAILRSYTEEALAKSRKENYVKKRPNGSKPTSRNGKNSKTNEGEGKEVMTGPDGDNGDSHSSQVRAFAETMEINSGEIKTFLSEASEEELVKELASRRAERFRLAGSMKRSDGDDDPTGQVCSLNGGNGSIPCRELME